ncbi:hypothetical protein AB0469_20790 [Streptomyces sp. NPDC093801]|uniref:hypothetical protein n=1 Tax=Streptomyces sp. NPDC093801 TaxID=3155203 RepID=UPI00344EA826
MSPAPLLAAEHSGLLHRLLVDPAAKAGTTLAAPALLALGMRWIRRRAGGTPRTRGARRHPAPPGRTRPLAAICDM